MVVRVVATIWRVAAMTVSRWATRSPAQAAGSAFSAEAGSFFTADGQAPRVGQTLIVIDPGARIDYTDRVQGLLDTIAHMEGARLPGTRRRAAIEAARTTGLNVPAIFVEQARALAGKN